MQGAHGFRKLAESEADLRARREVSEAEVDRVRPRVDSGVELRPVSDRTQDFGAVHTLIL